MARRYDSRTTTFSPEGRLYQVEYAMEAINNASLTIGIVAKDGIVLAANKMILSKLLSDNNEYGKKETLYANKEKIYTIDKHIICAVAGLTADANVLILHSRLSSQRYLYAYQEPQMVEQLVNQVCNTKQCYTQFGGLRPFGVSFLFAGYDKKHGFQLYHTDPSGNYSGWFATAIGMNNQPSNTMLKQEWKCDMLIDDALNLAAKVLVKTMDSYTVTSGTEQLEFAVLMKSESDDQIMERRKRDKIFDNSNSSDYDYIKQKYLSDTEVHQLIKTAHDNLKRTETE